MTVRALDALVLHTTRSKETVAFYRAIGMPLEEERHDDGPVHWACELGPVHFAVFDVGSPGARAEGANGAGPGAAGAGMGAAGAGAGNGRSPGRRQAGATQLGFQVSDLRAAVDALREGGAAVLQEPEEVSWGHRAVIADPDGRPVELNQATAGP